MLKLYCLLCIFALSSASRILSKIENNQQHSKKFSDYSVEKRFLKERMPKSFQNSSTGDPYNTCSNDRRAKNLFDQEDNDQVPFLIKLGIENETHFVITQEVLCNNQSGQLETTIYNDNRTNISSSSTQWVTLKIENGGLKQNQEHFQLQYNGEPFFLTGNTSEQVIVTRTDPHVDGNYVLYDDVLFKRIVDQLERNRSAISQLFRTEMLTDYFHFAGLGVRDYGSFFKLATNLIMSEEDPSVFEWWAFLTIFQVFGNQHRLQTHPLFLRANQFFESKINSRFSAASFQSQLEYIAQETGQAYPWPCLHLDSHCRDRLNNGLNFWKANPTSSLESISEKFGVISGYSTECLIVAAGGKESFDFMLEKAEKGEVSFQALGCATEPAVVKLVLNKIIDPNDKNFQSDEIKRMVWAYYVAFNKGVGALKFIRDNSEAFKTFYGEEAILNNVVAIFHWLSTKEQLKEIQEFTQMYPSNQDQTFVFSLLYESVEETIGDAEMEWRRNAILQWIAGLLKGSVY
ncbi:unnamed protein product [Orchesella dallaii]|uniref:ERAP1-like C-terminal domain-containing protein n=1 Tax=Orchesella dallaii TaxID=48710 RepID=A0ABP1S8P4_9HEXA